MIRIVRRSNWERNTCLEHKRTEDKNTGYLDIHSNDLFFPTPNHDHNYEYNLRALKKGKRIFVRQESFVHECRPACGRDDHRREWA